MAPFAKIVFLVLLVTQISAQHKVTFNLKDRSSINHDSIYLSGSFNNWNEEANVRYLLKSRGEDKKSITLLLPKGEIQYKYHRGNWSTVEKNFYGNEVFNRVIIISKDTILNDTAESWLDDFIEDKQIAVVKATHDSTLLYNYTALANAYAYYNYYYNLDSATHYANKANLILEKNKLTSKYDTSGKNKYDAEFDRYIQEINASIFHAVGNYSKSLELRLDNLQKAEKSNNDYAKSDVLWSIASLYSSMKDYKRMLECGVKMYALLADMDSSGVNYGSYKYVANYSIATASLRLNDYSKALEYAKKMEEISVSTNNEWYEVRTKVLLGDIYSVLNNYNQALDYFNKVEKVLEEQPNHFVALAWLGKAKLYKKTNQINSALLNAKKAYSFFTTSKLDGMVSGGWGENSIYYISETSPILSELYYDAGYPDSAYQYLKLYVSVVDTLFSLEKTNQFRDQIFNEDSRKQKEEIESFYLKKELNNKLKLYGLLICVVAFGIVFMMQFKNIQQKKKSNLVLKNALDNLESTQAQLIQSEKMASLGELTAGIAHEIQNPLNFVNNFSEVSSELIEEMGQEIDKGDFEEVKAIASDIKSNLDKINHHGKRADAIVKGMLEHSRVSSGEKVPTDINALCDEYLRLSYHGLRAKDKSFNAAFETDFAPNLPKMNVVSQDIGRVLLNLINNAFYAVNEKSKMVIVKSQDLASPPKPDYKPTVTVSTKNLGDRIEILIKDNGNGIPDLIKDKIFQPFFTTKPTGQGTGLGLSLSYDIVKAHGGSISVESQKDTGTTFIINL